MRILIALAAGVASCLAPGLASAQAGPMMDTGLWGLGAMGGYGTLLVAIPLVLAVVGLVAWAERQKYK